MNAKEFLRQFFEEEVSNEEILEKIKMYAMSIASRIQDYTGSYDIDSEDFSGLAADVGTDFDYLDKLVRQIW